MTSRQPPASSARPIPTRPSSASRPTSTWASATSSSTARRTTSWTSSSASPHSSPRGCARRRQRERHIVGTRRAAVLGHPGYRGYDPAVALSSRIGAATLTAEEALAYADGGPAPAELCERARERSPGPLVTYSPKVFIPLTHLCRDVCHYCTFARPPRRGERCYLTRRTRCSRSPTPAGSPGATRRCSRSATSPSCATGRRATSSSARLRHDRGLPGALSPASSCVRRACSPTPTPAFSTTTSCSPCARSARRRASCSRRRARSPVGARRAALRLARQAARRAPGRDRPRRAPGDPVHERHPDRHRRDAPRARRGADRAARPARAPRPPAGGDRAELPREGRARGWRSRPSPRSPITSGRSRSRGSCCRWTSPCRLRPTSRTPSSRACSRPASTTSAASPP